MVKNLSAVLTVNQLTKIFFPSQPFSFFKPKLPSFTAVDNLSFELYAGEILGILGPNGAGKTTTIQMLLGALSPTKGSIHYFGKDLFRERSTILNEISHASAYTKLPGSLTIEENLQIFARLYGLSKERSMQQIEKLLQAFGISSLRKRFMNTLSAGQTTRVLLAKAFLFDPKVVLLDEPTASLDPDIAKETRRFILQQQQEHGVSIILTSHNMQEVAEVCDRVLVLQKGVIIEEDSPEKLARSVALTNVTLEIKEGFDRALALLNEKNWDYRLHLSSITVELEEDCIATLLSQLAKCGVNYTRIDIRKPSLEDYFLHIAHQSSLNQV